MDRSVPRARAPQTVADIVGVRPLWTNFRRFGLPPLPHAPCRPFHVIFFRPFGPHEPALTTEFFSTLASSSSIPHCGGRTCSHLLFGASLANSCWIAIFSFSSVSCHGGHTWSNPCLGTCQPNKPFLDRRTSTSSSPCHGGRRRTSSDLLWSLQTPGTLVGVFIFIPVLSLDSHLVTQTLWTSLHQVGHDSHSQLVALPADWSSTDWPHFPFRWFHVGQFFAGFRISEPCFLTRHFLVSWLMMPSINSSASWMVLFLTFDIYFLDYLRLTRWSWLSLSTVHATRTHSLDADALFTSAHAFFVCVGDHCVWSGRRGVYRLLIVQYVMHSPYAHALVHIHSSFISCLSLCDTTLSCATMRSW